MHRQSLASRAASVRRRLLVVAVCALATIGGCPCHHLKPGFPPPPVVSDGVRMIAEQRSQAEDWALVLKREWAADTPVYRQSETLYIAAKAAFNGWIDQLKFDVQAGHRLESSQQYQHTLQRAVEKSEAFARYVQANRHGTVSAQVVVPWVDLIGQLTEAGIKIWQEWQRADQAYRDALKGELDKQKWRSFDAIAAG